VMQCGTGFAVPKPLYGSQLVGLPVEVLGLVGDAFGDLPRVRPRQAEDQDLVSVEPSRVTLALAAHCPHGAQPGWPGLGSLQCSAEPVTCAIQGDRADLCFTSSGRLTGSVVLDTHSPPWWVDDRWGLADAPALQR
jgi:hypothetical protein